MTTATPRVERPGRSTRSHPIALVLPAVVLAAVLMVVPIVTTVVRVVTDRGAGLSRLFAVPNFWPVMLNTVVWTVASIAGAVLIGYAGALLFRSLHLRLAGL